MSGAARLGLARSRFVRCHSACARLAYIDLAHTHTHMFVFVYSVMSYVVLSICVIWLYIFVLFVLFLFMCDRLNTDCIYGFSVCRVVVVCCVMHFVCFPMYELMFCCLLCSLSSL